MFRLPLFEPVILILCLVCVGGSAGADGGLLRLELRSRDKAADESSRYEEVRRAAAWDPKRTAVIIIDVWDKHWCEGANLRVRTMAGRFEAFVGALRQRGVFVIHAPSDTMKNYEGSPARKLAQDAPPANVAKGVTFKWNYLDKASEGELPIDDSDGGCDCQPQCKTSIAWKAQHPSIKIKPGDAVSDNGREIFNLLQQRGIDNVIVCGVHTNMCVLGRPFGIRQLIRLGKRVALVRDLTDTMYNPRKPPFVNHDRGTELIIEHIEKHWAPTITSDQILRKPSSDACE